MQSQSTSAIFSHPAANRTSSPDALATISLPHTPVTDTKEIDIMNNQPTVTKRKTNPVLRETASYFGLPVEVIARMPNYTSIRYGNREFVVESVDLRKSLAIGQAA